MLHSGGSYERISSAKAHNAHECVDSITGCYDGRPLVKKLKGKLEGKSPVQAFPSGKN